MQRHRNPGARKNELLQAKREHVNLDRKVWHIPMSKTGKARHVPLSQAALDIIAGLHHRYRVDADGDYSLA